MNGARVPDGGVPADCRRLKHSWDDPQAEETFCRACGRYRIFLTDTTGTDGVTKRRYRYASLRPFCAGTRVRLVSYYPPDGEEIPAGTAGTVVETLRNGVVIIDWDGFSKLGVLPGYDVIQEEAA